MEFGTVATCRIAVEALFFASMLASQGVIGKANRQDDEDRPRLEVTGIPGPAFWGGLGLVRP